MRSYKSICVYYVDYDKWGLPLKERQYFSMRLSRIFRQGGPGQTDKKKSFFFFFSPQLILHKSNGQFQRNLSFFKVPEGVQHFPGGGGGVQLFPGGGGVQLLFPYRNPYNMIFQGGPDPLSPPLDPHLFIPQAPFKLKLTPILIIPIISAIRIVVNRTRNYMSYLNLKDFSVINARF